MTNKKILLIDMHNTLVDETKEYGPAIDKAVDVFIEAARRNNPLLLNFDAEKFKTEQVYPQLKKAHAELGDDWDNRAFDKKRAPALAALFSDEVQFETARQEAIRARTEFSKDYVTKNVYPGAVDFIKQAKAEGHTVYIVTDGNANVAEATLSWLGLDGVADKVFCPHSKPEAYSGTPRLQTTPVTPFAPDRFKPDALIVADILLDYAKKNGLVPSTLSREAVFTLEEDASLPKDAGAVLKQKLKIIPDTEYSPLFTMLLSDTIGIGDDARDQVMFKNAGITSVASDYGKVDKSAPETARGKAILKAVTGWSPERLGLLGMAEVDSWVKTSVQPDYHLTHSLAEAAPLLSNGPSQQAARGAYI